MGGGREGGDLHPSMPEILVDPCKISGEGEDKRVSLLMRSDELTRDDGSSRKSVSVQEEGGVAGDMGWSQVQHARTNRMIR